MIRSKRKHVATSPELGGDIVRIGLGPDDDASFLQSQAVPTFAVLPSDDAEGDDGAAAASALTEGASPRRMGLGGVLGTRNAFVVEDALSASACENARRHADSRVKRDGGGGAQGGRAARRRGGRGGVGEEPRRRTRRGGRYPFLGIGKEGGGSPGPPMLALPEASKRVYLISDIGRTSAVLKHEFPYVDFDMCRMVRSPSGEGAEDDEAWWWQKPSPSLSSYVEWRPSGAGQSYACPGEPQFDF
ncbi:hypothetical protein THAOC_11782 [Thalassiosira oceanica]|uniref:Uncharacterized protein n=1 Tax=Thalassiosira oceanica TaxID=159749 RepID=K0SPJ7_THAOC|nr:hypothetical protein THAOC_11782 [Thalassiosira oceanica]|eukprot:EJK67215.1 hypothetical protein THAOC_11782 [Thalassiosira oceanica]